MNTDHPDPAPSLRERLRILIEGAPFERFITALIIANVVTLGIETSPPVAARFGDSLHLFDRLVLAVFVVELLRFLVHRGRFFRGPWRVFDLVVVGIAVVPAGGAILVQGRSPCAATTVAPASIAPCFRKSGRPSIGFAPSPDVSSRRRDGLTGNPRRCRPCAGRKHPLPPLGSFWVAAPSFTPLALPSTLPGETGSRP